MSQVRTPLRKRMRGICKTQALGGFQVAAFEAREEEPSGGALLGQRNGVPAGRFLADTGAADDDAGVAHIPGRNEAVHEAAEDDDVEGVAEEVFGGGDGDGRSWWNVSGWRLLRVPWRSLHAGSGRRRGGLSALRMVVGFRLTRSQPAP